MPEEEPEEERKKGCGEHSSREVAERILVLSCCLLRRRVCLHTRHRISPLVLTDLVSGDTDHFARTAEVESELCLCPLA